MSFRLVAPPAVAFETALDALKTDRARTRSAVVALGIAMAVVVCLTTLVERSRAATVQALEEAGLTNLYLVNRPTSAAHGAGARRLSVSDVERLAAVLPVRSTVAVRIARRDVVFGGAPFSAPVYAVRGDLQLALGARPRAGRLLGDLDVSRKSPYCLVGSDVVRLARLTETLGSVVNVGSRSYEVVGEIDRTSIESSSTGEIPSIEWSRAIVVPLGAEPEAVEEADARYPVDFAVLGFDSIREVDAAMVALDKPRSGRSADEPGFRVASPVQTLRQYKATRRTFDRLIWLVCLLTASSAVFGISNQLSASVIARTREIGVRRAVGARSIDIVMQFQAEGVLLGVVGGGLGLLVGLMVSLLTADRSNGGFSLSVPSFCALAAGCVVIGILTGIHPAARAARIDPAAALREG